MDGAIPVKVSLAIGSQSVSAEIAVPGIKLDTYISGLPQMISVNQINKACLMELDAQYLTLRQLIEESIKRHK